MAQSAIEKGVTLFKTKIHGLLDRQIDADAPGVLRTYIRDIEVQLEDIDNSAAERAGHVRTLQRQIERIEAKEEELNKNIELLVGDDDPSNDHIALKFEVELQGLEEEEASAREQLAQAQTDSGELDNAVSLLRARHADMIRQLRRLESMDKAAKAQEKVADTVRRVAEMSGDLEAVSVDDAAARLEARIDAAGVKFERAMGTFTESAENQVAIASAKARLAERIAKKNAEKTPEPTPAAAS